jgi:hypothetical protein
MTQGGSQLAAARRDSYLATALELRTMARRAQSPEMQQGFMQLAVLYEELAEYTGVASSANERGVVPSRTG